MRGPKGLEEVVHGFRRVVSHLVEDVGVAPERHDRIRVPEHLGDLVYGGALVYSLGRSGVAEVMEADLGREAGLLEEALEVSHHDVAPADLADGVGEDEPGIGPARRSGGHPLLELALGL